MIKQMDDIGRRNDNGQRGDSAMGLPIQDALEEDEERRGKVVFW